MSDLSESFFASSRGNLANYVLPFQMPKPPKKVLKGENAGDTPYVIFASPLMCYLPVQSSNGQETTQPIRSGWHLTCDHTSQSEICQTFHVIFARPFMSYLPVSQVGANTTPANQNWLAFNLCCLANMTWSWQIWHEIYSCWNFFLRYWQILYILYEMFGSCLWFTKICKEVNPTSSPNNQEATQWGQGFQKSICEQGSKWKVAISP